MPQYTIKMESGLNEETYNVTFMQQCDDSAAEKVDSDTESEEEGVLAATSLASTAEAPLSFQVAARFFTENEDDKQLSLTAALTIDDFRKQVRQSLAVYADDGAAILKQICDVLMSYVREVLAKEGLAFTLGGDASEVHSADFQNRFSKLQSISSLLTSGVFKLGSLADRQALVESLRSLKAPLSNSGFFDVIAYVAHSAAGTGSRLDAAVDACVEHLDCYFNTSDCVLQKQAKGGDTLLFLNSSGGSQQRCLLLPQYQLPVSYLRQIKATGFFIQRRDMPATVSFGCGTVNCVQISQQVFSASAFEKNQLFSGYQKQLENVNQCLLDLRDEEPPSVFVAAHLWADFIRKVEAMRSSSTQQYDASHESKAIAAFCDLLCSKQDLDCYYDLVQAGPLSAFMQTHFFDEMQRAQAKVAASSADDERVAADVAIAGCG